MTPNPHRTAMAVAILAALLMLPIVLVKCALERLP